MAEYRIAKVSQQNPREWKGDRGTVYYIKVMLEGHDRPVSIGKKSPDALHEGDTVYGTITPDPNHDEDKFKSESKPFGGGKSNYQPKDEEAIARSVALKAAVDALAYKDGKSGDVVTSTIHVAEQFLAWLKERPETPRENKDEPRYTNEEGF